MLNYIIEMSITANHSSLDVFEKPTLDRSIQQAEYLRVNPTDQTVESLNNNGAQIRFKLNATDSFLLMKDSYLRVEGNILKNDGTDYAADDPVSLSNNGVMHCFREVLFGQPCLGFLSTHKTLQLVRVSLRDR